MADAKGDGDSGATLWPIVVGVIILALFLGLSGSNLFNVPFLNIEEIFSRIWGVAGGAGRTIVSPHTWSIVSTVSAVFSLFFIVIIVFSIVRIREIQVNDKVFIEEMINHYKKKSEMKETGINPRWQHVLSLAASENESDWRLSIIEADAMLDDFLKEKGYFGDTMGDRLKSAKEGGAFATYKSAIEAHGIRNRIAHEGTNFSVSQMETRRIMRLYESVFEEFGVI